ncbi:MAG: MBOAT family protein [Akkermansia sp.]|nr:MBOAT family protein [Akkermansia sp.]
MLFNSWEFLILLLITLLCFYAIPRCAAQKCIQTTIFITASAVFYAWEDWRLLALLVISCGGNAAATVHILSKKIRGDEAGAHFWVKMAIILNLALLGLFKYAGLVVSSIPGIPQNWVDWVCSIPLPIGISFYTFHGISMVVDMSRGKVHAYDQMLQTESKVKLYSTTMRDMGLYLLMFPQLIAGPIIKAHYFWPQIKAKLWNNIDWARALRYLITGYFFKMVVADNLSPVTEVLTSSEFITRTDGATLLMILLGYSIQIFADFGGYSMIAIGLAALFGYRFPINFNFPYISTSLTQFWQRWNMTLSAWLRDYLYIPLGGNRKGAARTYINLFLVMFLGGLWHGADWKFALWGSMHGLVLAIERFIGNTSWGKRLRIPQWISIPYCFIIVCALWTTFLMPNIDTVYLFFHQVCTHFSCSPAAFIMNPSIYSVCLYASFIVIYHIWGWWRENKQRHQPVHRGTLSFRGACIYGFMLFMILTNSGPQCGFVYFQF